MKGEQLKVFDFMMHCAIVTVMLGSRAGCVRDEEDVGGEVICVTSPAAGPEKGLVSKLLLVRQQS
eukprot:1157388-Pelagomonas_calceolata.AAC.21